MQRRLTECLSAGGNSSGKKEPLLLWIEEKPGEFWKSESKFMLLLCQPLKHSMSSLIWRRDDLFKIRMVMAHNDLYAALSST